MPVAGKFLACLLKVSSALNFGFTCGCCMVTLISRKSLRNLSGFGLMIITFVLDFRVIRVVVVVAVEFIDSS